MILSLFVGLLAVSPAHASSASVVCKSSDYRYTWMASSESAAQLWKDGQLLNVPSEITNERGHDQSEPEEKGCDLGKANGRAETIDRYRATLHAEGQRVDVECEAIDTMTISCVNENDLSGLGGDGF